ncbi:MAG: TetR/AcrR family transcriptional regulator, partial [Candidatus Omnitrophica bacterium]|nr:TetR/AcrR family transcriptional regulator [Candidatus Omnitrophota bacterium]
MNPLPRKARDKLLRRTDILSAATRVFAEKGYHNATMSDIARQAEYAVGTIYLYFKDKQALYLALTDEKIEELIRRVKERIAKAHGALAKIKAFIEEEFAYFEENEDFFRIYFSEGGLDSCAIKDKPSRLTVEKIMKFLDYISGI